MGRRRACDCRGGVDGFDGVRALTVGDFVTVDGELGPWADLLDALGIDPRATAVKVFFVLYGAAWLFAVGAFASDLARSRAAMAVFAAGSVWISRSARSRASSSSSCSRLDRRLRPA